MSIKVTCPDCGTKLNAKDSLAGRRVKCPSCGSPVDIPDPGAEEVYEAEEIGGGGEFDFGDIDPSGGEQVEDRKPCPACGEMIMPSAAKCRYCGEIFDPALKKRERRSRSQGSADSDEDMGTGDWVVAIICPGIGCIAGIVYLIMGKPKGLKMTGVSLAMTLLWSLINAALENAIQQN